MATKHHAIPWTIDLGPAFNFAHTAADKKALKRATKACDPQPQSRLLSLPSELRVLIYTEVALETESIALKSNRLVIPLLGRVCRQIEREYCDVYTELAPQIAPSIKIYCENFAYKHIPLTVNGLPPQSYAAQLSQPLNTQRQFIMIFFITNEFLHQIHNIRSIGREKAVWDPNGRFSYQVACDARVIDTAFCRQKLLPALHYLEFRGRYSERQGGLEKTCADALDRADGEQAASRQRSSRKRKR